jgi:hypothetical protein
MTIGEISLVDNPACPGANVLLAKRGKSPSSTLGKKKDDIHEEGSNTMTTASPEAIANLQKKLEKAALKKESLKELLKSTTATFKAEIDELKKQLKVASLSPEDKEYRATLSKADADEFDNMSDDDKAKKKAKQPIDKNLPAYVQELMAKNKTNEERLAKADEAAAIVTFGKRAVGLGLDEKSGETLRKAYTGDETAITALEQLIKGLTAQVAAGSLYKNFGSNLGAGGEGSAEAEINTIAKELVAKGEAKSVSSAIAKIAGMPQHREIWKRYKEEGVAVN